MRLYNDDLYQEEKNRILNKGELEMKPKIKIRKSEKGITYFIVDARLMPLVTDNPFPICGECCEDLNGQFILIPILNEIYHVNCGKKVVESMNYYPEDEEIEQLRIERWSRILGIKVR